MLYIILAVMSIIIFILFIILKNICNIICRDEILLLLFLYPVFIGIIILLCSECGYSPTKYDSEIKFINKNISEYKTLINEFNKNYPEIKLKDLQDNSFYTIILEKRTNVNLLITSYNNTIKDAKHFAKNKFWFIVIYDECLNYEEIPLFM
jgi:hypothetical protein